MPHAPICLIDSHCHLADPRFDADRPDVLARAAAAGIDSWVVPAVHRGQWSRLHDMAALRPSVYPAYGMHPWHHEEHHRDDLALLAQLLPQAVAVGECGLDAGRGRAPLSEQLVWFRAQLDLAIEFDLPVIVHGYKTLDTICREMRARPGLRGVVHGFTGSQQQAGELLGLGFLLGIGAAITRPQNRRLQAVVEALPADALLLESDAPDQPPFSHRGRRNEPAWLLEIAERLATLRAVPLLSLVEQCNENARGLFRL